MAKSIITNSLLTAIANAIRNKLGVQDTYTPAEMATAIASIPTGASLEFSGAECAGGAAWNKIVPAMNTHDATDMQELFCFCQSENFNPDFSDFDTSNVTRMYRMFYQSSGSNFNPDITGWDVRKVQNMGGMFYQCMGAAFNPDFTHWVTSALTDTSYMFNQCSGAAFNPDFSGSGFDTSHVTKMSYMFYNCNGAAFNPDLTPLDVSSVKEFTYMFANCNNAAFNAIDLDGWTNTQTGVKAGNMFSSVARNTHKKLWYPKTLHPTSFYAGNSNQPFVADPGTQKLDVYTDAASAAELGITATIHSNFTMHYNSTHAAFVNA